MEESRPEVYEAAGLLFDLVNEKGGEILKKVKKCEMFHLKRVMFILGGKLAEKLP